MTTALAPRPLAAWLDTVSALDAETLLRSLPAGSVNCIVTSPPYYGLRNYSVNGQIGLEDTPERYVRRLVALFRVARQALREDGVLWLNLGDSYANDGKWGGATGGKHTADLHGHTGIGRQRQHTGLKPKDLMGIPWRVALALQADGWWLRSDIIWHKPNPMPESVTDRPTVAHEYVFLLTKQARYWYDADAVREPAQDWGLRDRSNGKYHHEGTGLNPHAGLINSNNAEYGRNLRTVWTIPTEPKPFQHFAMFPQALVEPMIKAGCPAKVCATCGAPWGRVVDAQRSNYISRIDRQIATGGAITGGVGKNFPHTTRQTLGFRPTCDCATDTRPGVVCDPFMGSGTTALVAQRLGRHYIGSDLNAAYVALANDRLRYRGDDARMVSEQAAGVEQLALFEAVAR